MSEFVPAINTSDLAPGEGTTVDLSGKQVAIFNVEGSFYAIDDTCPHAEGPLGDGELDGKVVECPWHAWCFDVTTGDSPSFPGVTVACYPTKVENGQVFVAV